MITKRFREARGLDADTPFYGFYVRMTREEASLLRQAKDKASRRLGGSPSNPMLLQEMLKEYVGEAA